MTLAKLICLTRKARGLTLRALEKSSGLSNSLISQVETGWIDDLSLRNAAKLAKALGLSLDVMAQTKPVKKNRRNATKVRIL